MLGQPLALIVDDHPTNRLRRNGFDDVLVKPINRQQLETMMPPFPAVTMHSSLCSRRILTDSGW